MDSSGKLIIGTEDFIVGRRQLNEIGMVDTLKVWHGQDNIEVDSDG